jgi:hypothetical protein
MFMPTHKVKRHPVSGYSYTPEELAGVRKAFDEAWYELRAELTGETTRSEVYRLGLASIVMDLAEGGLREPHLLRICATRQFLRVFELPRSIRRG